jgi:hypothetical protein
MEILFVLHHYCNGLVAGEGSSDGSMIILFVKMYFLC